MKECPYCKGKMEVGYIPTDAIPSQWIPESERINGIRFCNAKNGKKLVAEKTALGNRAKAYYCNKCGIVLLNEDR